MDHDNAAVESPEGPCSHPERLAPGEPQRRTAANWGESRLRKHADYQKVYSNSKKQFSSSMTWFLARRPNQSLNVSTLPARDLNQSDAAGSVETCPRVGLTVGKVIGKAHERNRIKRRMREIVRNNLHELPGSIDLVLHPRRSVMTMDFLKLEAEVLRIFRQARSQTMSSARGNRRVEQPGHPTAL